MLGAFVNILLVFKVLIRPVLWSTINIFNCILLSLNALHLLLDIFLTSLKTSSSSESAVLSSLDYLYLDSHNSLLCCAKVLGGYLYRESTLLLLLGQLVIRLMLVEHPENIRTNLMACKTYQAKLSSIALLLSLYITAVLIAETLAMNLIQLFPYDFVLVRHCRDVPLSYTYIENKWTNKIKLIKMAYLFLMLLFTLFLHLRFIYLKRNKHRCQFSKTRQCIVTLNQTLVAAYLQLTCALLRQLYINLILNNSPWAT